LIYLDSCIVIYALEDRPPWTAAVLAALAADPMAQFGVSPLVKAECLVGALRSGDRHIERRYWNYFAQISVMDMPESVYLDAARLRANAGLKLSDALHLACAQHHGCSALWTNDTRLSAAGGPIVRTLSIS
jgi:predicted nucleic acid-binding protein